MSDVTAVPLRPVGKGGLTALWVGIVLLLLIGIGGAWAASQNAKMAGLNAVDFMIANGKRRGVLVTESGVQYQVLKAGAGPTPTEYDIAQLEYAGTLTDGTQFDATKPGEPVTIALDQVVAGFADAVTQMPKGARYRVWIPPQLGYGARPVGPIPPNSVLVFDIILHDFAARPRQPALEPGLAQQEALPQDGAPADGAPQEVPLPETGAPAPTPQQ